MLPVMADKLKPTEILTRTVMKPKNPLPMARFGLLLSLVVALQLASSDLFAEETKFTYQGRLNDASGPANGVYDLTFTIYDLPTGNGAFAVETNLATGVTNGLFTTTVDFGSVVSELIFSGPERWLEIA